MQFDVKVFMVAALPDTSFAFIWPWGLHGLGRATLRRHACGLAGIDSGKPRPQGKHLKYFTSTRATFSNKKVKFKGLIGLIGRTLFRHSS